MDARIRGDASATPYMLPRPLQIARITACRTALATRVDALAENVTAASIGVEGRIQPWHGHTSKGLKEQLYML